MPVAPVARPRSTSKGYSWAEVEKFLASGNVRGNVTRHDLPTPALLLDLDAFEFNVDKMARHCREHSRALRPHGKTHKCPEIANRLIRAGAVGACTAKLSEAEVFAAHGVRGLLITTPVIGKHKIERAIRLAKSAPDTMFCVDDRQNVHDLSQSAGLAGIELNIMLDLCVGRRDGVFPGAPALELARLVVATPRLKLVGIQAYAGHTAHVVGFEERAAASREAMAPAVETRRLLEKDGIECPLMSSASTGTYNIDCHIDGITELQPGSFMFMDIDYNRIGGQDGPVYRDFRNSLSVLTTVVSKPTQEMAVVDGGLKAFSTDKPFMPEAKDVPGLVYTWGGDEHGRLNLTNAARDVNVGDRIEFVIPHCDPTVNLHDQLFCLRGDDVEDVWPISARGMGQ